MMNFLRSLVVGVVLSVLGIGSANAVLIGVTDYGDYFSDAGTGLDWLDVTASAGRSYNDVSTQFGAGGDFEGWRYATAAEFGAMLSATTNGVFSGITGVDQNQILESATDLRDLVGLFGDVFGLHYQATNGGSYCELYPSSCPDGDLVYSNGYLADSYSSSLQYRGIIIDDDAISRNLDSVSTRGFYGKSDTYGFLGSYLVRDTSITSVPEPATLALMGVGLAGFGFARRKKAH